MEYRKLICTNDLIDSTKKYNSLELKIFYNMLYCCKEQSMYDVDFKESKTTYMTLKKLEGYLGGKHLTNKDLINIVRSVPKGIYSKDNLSYIGVFDFIKYNNEEKQFEFKVSELFKPYIDDVIKNFTVLELKELSYLNSIYSQRLFEFCSKNKNLPMFIMPIETFKEYFKIPENYAMCNIDQRIIEPAINDINTNTKFNVTIEKIKNKNRVTHIRFIIGIK